LNKFFILRTMGLLLIFEAVAMVPSLFLAAYYGEADLKAFIISIIIIVAVGYPLARLRFNEHTIGYKEGFAVATLGWLFMAVFGALPYIISGSTSSVVDAFFETMSGFTTTGASIFPDVESLTHGILFWRSLTHWLGGMGIIVLTLALIPSLKIAGLKLFKAEVPGPTKGKVLPSIAQTSRQLYKLYLGITVIEILLLKVAGMSWFDSFIHTFGTVATGGFSSQNGSIGAYNSLTVELIIVFFMVISGINFALHYRVIRGNLKAPLRDPETRLYLSIIAVGVLLISFNLIYEAGFLGGQAFRKALFQVVSITTTTGYATADFDAWPNFSRAVLVVLMFVGGCAGSTGGGMKVIRHLILFKGIKRQLVRLIHPQAVMPLRVGRDVVQEYTVQVVQTFFIIYMFIFAFSTVFISAMGYDLITAFSSVAVTLGNIGPGLGLVGPASTYVFLPPIAKVWLSLLMLIGRLEIYTVLVMLSARFWK